MAALPVAQWVTPDCVSPSRALHESIALHVEVEDLAPRPITKIKWLILTSKRATTPKTVNRHAHTVVFTILFSA